MPVSYDVHMPVISDSLKGVSIGGPQKTNCRTARIAFSTQHTQSRPSKMTGFTVVQSTCAPSQIIGITSPMTTAPRSKPSVVKMPTPSSSTEKEKRKLEDRFTRQVVGSYGFTQLPNLLLFAQARLKITPTQFNVLLHLIQHWWDADKPPHPKIETIARRVGKSQRMVLRYLEGLESAGLIRRVHRYRGKQRQISSAYKLDGLRDRLIELEPEFRKAKEFRDKRQKRAETAA